MMPTTHVTVITLLNINFYSRTFKDDGQLARNFCWDHYIFSFCVLYMMMCLASFKNVMHEVIFMEY